ncbi:MAG: YkoP family protein [Bacillota bacterium]
MPRLIELWDRLARKALGVRPLGESTVVGYAIRRYPGRSLTAADGTVLARGEPVIELHLDSRLLAAQTAGANTHQRVLFLLREVIAGLHVIARLVRSDPALAKVRGVWGVTILNRVVDRLGFTVVDLTPGFTRWITTRYLKWLLSSYHPDGEERLHQREEELVPREIFMSTETLLSRYGQERSRLRQPKPGSDE